jgi:hypothetical protein
MWSGAPRLDVLGKRAIAHTLGVAGHATDEEDMHYPALAGDLAANTAYYSMVGFGRSRPVLCGALLGLVAGIGAVLLPEPLGLGRGETRRSAETALATIGLYTLGGLTAGAVFGLLDSEDVLALDFPNQPIP